MGELDGKPIFCSETCALDIIGAKFVRDIENGEIVICEIQPDGSITIDARKPQNPLPERLCLFEYVYFARPDSVVGGRNVYVARKNMGKNLAIEAPVEADVVVPVPDGGTPAAIGYAQESGIPFELGIIRNHYVGRTFIEPTQQIRAFGVKLKHSANRAMIAGKRVVLVDDSIVRGTTSVKIVQMMREAGAREVHVRVASPMIFHPDFYGIDTPDRDKLLANQHADLASMCRFIGADSLEFLSIDGLYRAVGGEKRDPQAPQSPITISPGTTRPAFSTRGQRATFANSRFSPARITNNNMTPNLKDRIAVVTGASRGIGYFTALEPPRPAPTSSPAPAPSAVSKNWTTRSRLSAVRQRSSPSISRTWPPSTSSAAP